MDGSGAGAAHPSKRSRSGVPLHKNDAAAAAAVLGRQGASSNNGGGAHVKRDREHDDASSSTDGAKKHKAGGKGGGPVYPFGNYPAYYVKRLPGGVSDPRLGMFKREWFEGLRVLDVGCNVGVLTMDLVRKMGALEVVGVDVDPALVRRARAAAAALPHPNDTESIAAELGVPWVPMAFRASMGPVRTMSSAAQFVCCDFVEHKARGGGGGSRSNSGVGSGEGSGGGSGDDRSRARDGWVDAIAGAFDAVVCLSTSKWIHLNHGDEGIKRLFARVHAALKPGGVFIFEPQPWKSYRNARGTTATIDAHFASIALRPSTFIEYLTTEGGFSRVETLGTSTAAEGATFGAGKGAQRGIYALFK